MALLKLSFNEMEVENRGITCTGVAATIDYLRYTNDLQWAAVIAMDFIGCTDASGNYVNY
jgi:hypothetical protein